MKKILALGNYTDAMYHGFAGVDEQLKKILGKDFEVVCTDDTRELLALEKYDGFVCYLDIWESKLAEAEVQGILDFARSGGGILILHNGISIENDERLAALMGGKFTGHPPMEKLEFVPERNEITTGYAAFSMEEEPYQFEMINTNAKREVLLRYIYQGKEYLGGWSLESQAGRLVFLAPGHTPEQFACEAYGKLIRTCANWCMKNE